MLDLKPLFWLWLWRTQSRQRVRRVTKIMHKLLGFARGQYALAACLTAVSQKSEQPGAGREGTQPLPGQLEKLYGTLFLPAESTQKTLHQVKLALKPDVAKHSPGGVTI